MVSRKKGGIMQVERKVKTYGNGGRKQVRVRNARTAKMVWKFGCAWYDRGGSK
jgi:hypothetical protein